jgi:hypothetical protein
MPAPTRVNGGYAEPVVVKTGTPTQGGTAIPVFGYKTLPTSDGRGVIGGPARPVIVLQASDLKENGGKWQLRGDPVAMPVYTAVAGQDQVGGDPIAVFPINSWP